MKIPINIKSGEIQKETAEKKNVIVGIDLGTTNSLIAIIDSCGNPQTLRDNEGYALVPSIVHFDVHDEVVVGNQAKRFLVEQPNRTIYSVKRLLGRSYKDLEDVQLNYTVIANEDEYALAKIKVGEKYFSPVELSGLILKELKRRAEFLLKQEISQAVITVPAYFNDAQRQATRDAGKLAGLDVLRIVNEPTAASLAYGHGLNREEKKTIAVFDLGGGTFDISILQLEDGVFEVMSTHGDTHLGGDDIDLAIMNYWIQEYHVIDLDFGNRQSLRLLAEQAKVAMGTQTEYTAEWQGYTLHLHSNVYAKLIQPVIDKTLACCQNALSDSGLGKEKIDEVLLVGGSTRIPQIKNAVSEFFGKTANDSMNPDEVVALGAAIQADILAGNRKDILLLDVTPLSLGIETLGGLMDVIIPRNTKVPSRAGRQYTTSVDGQKNLMINVFQGERDLVSFNRKLGSFTLKEIPPMPAGLPKIEIAFILDADGILTVKAKELRSSTQTQVEIKSTYGISEEEMAKMLLDSIQNAKADMEVKSKQEAIVEGGSLVLATEKFIKNNLGVFSEDEVVQLQQLLENLKKSINEGQKDSIQKSMDELNKFANPLAHRSMDHTIQQALKGEKVL